MPQDDYTITTDPSGALLQNIKYITYTNTDLSYIPEYTHTYVLDDIELNNVSKYFYPYAGPALLDRYIFGTGFMTYDTKLNKIYIGNVQVISEWTGTSLINVFTIDTTKLPPIFVVRTLGAQLWFRGIAYNPQNNLIYGVVYENARTISCIIVIDIETRSQTNFVLNNVEIGLLVGLTFDMSNNLYATDNSNYNVIKIALTDNYSGDGTIIASFLNGVFKPTGITCDQFNNVYVSNAGSNNVLKISKTGDVSIFASGFDNPQQIQYNFINNIIYIANVGVEISGSPYRTYINTISNGIVTIITNTDFLSLNFVGITIDSVGNVYFTNYNNGNKIGKLYTISTITKCANTFNTSFRNYSIGPITDVALNSTKTKLYASQYIAPWPAQPPYDPLRPYYPYGIIWDISLNNNPSFTPNIFYPKRPITDPSMNNPTSIAFDTSNNLYVGNSVDSKILVIDTSANGNYLNIQWDISGIVTNGPTGLVFNNTRNLYFANYLSNTICKLTFTTNTYSATGIILPITGASISFPTSLAIDNLNNILYIANSGLNNILSVNLDTYTATIYSTITNGGGQNPPGIVYDSTSGLLYLTDNYKNNVNFIANNPIINNIPLSNTPKIITPQGLTIDTSNNLYVANYGNYDAPIVKIRQDISSVILYNSTISSITSGVYISVWYKSNNIAGTYLFSTSSNSNFVKIIDPLGNIILYRGATSSLSGMSIGIVRNVETPATNHAPYFIYTNYTYAGIWALAPNPTSPDPLYAIPINGKIDISGNIPNYNNITFLPDLEYGMTFDDAPVDISGNFYFYISDASNNCISKVQINKSNYFKGYGVLLNIDFAIINFTPGHIAITSDSSTMFCLEGGTLSSGSNRPTRVCKINLNAINPPPSSPYIPVVIATNPFFQPANRTTSIAVDNKGYVYVLYQMISNGDRYVRLAPNPNPSNPNYIIETLVPSSISTPTGLNRARCIDYSSTENCIVVAGEKSIEKIYLSFLFDSSGAIGPYSNTLNICDVESGTSSTQPPVFQFNFDVYEHYIVIDPSNIPNNTATDISIYFINPSVLPNPTDTYYLLCGTTNPTKIADAFCNNCTYNKTDFVSGTYPTGLVYSDFSKYLYVALQNDTISRINPLGIVENNYIPEIVGLKGPTSVVLDASFNMYVLNVTGGFITKLTLASEIITEDNAYYTNIATPICLTYDHITKKYLYLLSGKVPNMVITQIDIANPSNFKYLPIPFGSLYNSNGLVIGAPTIYEGYLYVSNTDQFEVNSIKKFDLLDASYNLTTELSGLSYKPYTLDYFNQHLYVSNKDLPSSITKIRVANKYLNIPASATQPWASNGISIPSGLTHDASDNLYIANTGTGPRNSRISKIYIEYFPFDNVVLPGGACANAQIYDDTTKSYVNVYYNNDNPTIFPIPAPPPS
jgi:hypothetical protein